jgi:hypothetical protein
MPDQAFVQKGMPGFFSFSHVDTLGGLAIKRFWTIF